MVKLYMVVEAGKGDGTYALNGPQTCRQSKKVAIRNNVLSRSIKL